MREAFLSRRATRQLRRQYWGPNLEVAVPAIKDRATTAAALSVGVAAMFAAVMPLNLGLIAAALVGVVGGLVAESVTERRRR